MRRTRLIGLVVGMALLACPSVQLAGPSEPRYAGKRLTKWLEDYQMKIWQGKFGPDGDDWAKDGPVEFAIREIGTNGIPTMLALLRTQDSRAKSLLLDLIDKQSLVTLPLKRDHDKHGMAWLGFSLLGTNAVSASYELASFAGSANESARMRALESLKEIQPPRELYIPALFNFLHDSNPFTGYLAGEELGRIAPEEARKASVYDLFAELKPADSHEGRSGMAQQGGCTEPRDDDLVSSPSSLARGR
jgi:hypothetical protein